MLGLAVVPVADDLPRRRLHLRLQDHEGVITAAREVGRLREHVPPLVERLLVIVAGVT
jgi:hypothetical protein